MFSGETRPNDERPMSEATAWTAKIRKAVTLGFFVMLLFALIGNHPVLSQSASSDERPVTGIDGMPLELSLVFGAAVMRMRGLDDPEAASAIILSPSATNALKSPGFNLETFTLIGTALTDWSKLSDKPLAYSINAMLIFADPVGRRATLSLVADYHIQPDHIEISNASLLPMTPPDPDIVLFVVPAKDVTDDILTGRVSDAAFLEFMSEKAVTKQGDAPSTEQDYYVFSYSIDRLLPDAYVELQDEQSTSGLKTINFHGWQVAIARASFAINSGQEKTFKAIYQPGLEALNQKLPSPRVLATFSTNRITLKDQ